MAPSERSEGLHPDEISEAQDGFALVAKPSERPQLTQTPDGGFTIFFRGEIRIAYRPPAVDAAESPIQPETGGTDTFPDSSEAVRSQSRLLHAEQTAATNAQAPVEAPESPVPDAEGQSDSLAPEHTSSPLSEPHSGAEKPSWEQSLTDEGQIPESENRKFQLVGNPARKLGYRVTRKSNTRIADFVLATHPEEETTEYWRIRAFGKEAEKVRDQVEVGQKGVEVTVYGPKYWKGRKKTNDGYEDTLVKDYHAGFVKVPKRYRNTEQKSP